MYRSYLDNLVATGDLSKVGKGMYVLPGAEPSLYRSFVEVAAAIPGSVIALTSALSFHDIGAQLPRAVWVAFPRQSRSYVPAGVETSVESVRMDRKVLSDGVEEHTIEGVTVRIHSAEKTLADCFKYLGRVGLDETLEALKDAWNKDKLDMDMLFEYASRDRVWNKMKPYIEMA
ncbi:transcriptional regulator [Capsulimonas corticalis]|uniref:Transcriptional regulator n=1 Tax=Capsulimonas corticalis TaxID=2219043 RepID=A0A402CZ95_9BACT|nr:transcriptional regulator [Capsulimonas corticalis]BDI29460.1 transcriptional regulator [Capsulimonas corticalis]